MLLGGARFLLCTGEDLFPGIPPMVSSSLALVPDVDLDQVVAELNALSRKDGLAPALRIGALLLDTFFDGSAAVYRVRSGAHPGYRALLRREDLVPTSGFLWHAVAIHEQHESLPLDIADSLSISQHRVLLPVRDARLKLRLARRAAEEHLTKRELEALVQRWRRPRKGRPPLPALVKAERQAARAAACLQLDAADARAWGIPRCHEALDRLERHLADLARRAAVVRRRLEALEEPDRS